MSANKLAAKICHHVTECNMSEYTDKELARGGRLILSDRRRVLRDARRRVAEGFGHMTVVVPSDILDLLDHLAKQVQP